MKHRTILSTAAAVAMLTLATPGYSATPEEAKAMSERAAAYIKQVGEDKAFTDFTRADGGFKDGELYVFCYDHDGVNKAHGANPAFVGKNLLHFKDPDGKEANAEIVKTGVEPGPGLDRLQVAQSAHQEDPAEVGLCDPHQRRRVRRRLLQGMRQRSGPVCMLTIKDLPLWAKCLPPRR